ncbi:hypothetical protein JHK85_025162 [Glycine max]|nr:hypothetical protein JHK85_025162 [Glycine max]
MGQGLHTKVAQIAASAFHIPLCSMKEVLINLFKVFIPNQDHTKMMTNTEQTATTAHMGVSFKLLSADVKDTKRERQKGLFNSDH